MTDRLAQLREKLARTGAATVRPTAAARGRTAAGGRGGVPRPYDGVKALIVNSYGGSLTVAVSQLGLPIVASLEDCGYGLDAQRHNFPDLTYVEKYPWPDLDLRDTVVIAHPPCAGFCAQNVNAPARAVSRGLDGTYFAQTKAVLDYALPKRPPAVLVESVKGAYEPTRAFYDELAAAHGYHVYRVLQNAVTFGVPQWRPRFWAVLVRKDAAPDPFIFQHLPNALSVGEALADVAPGEPIPGVERCTAAQLKKFRAAGLAEEVIAGIMAGEYGYGPTNKVLPKGGIVEVKGHDVDFLRKYCYSVFVSNNPVVLDPEGYAPTLMSSSIWWYQGKTLTAPAYNALMGYPLDYWFPPPKHLVLRSKGVAPPVARWLLAEVLANLYGGPRDEVVVNMTSVQALRPGETANFLPSKGSWKEPVFRFEPTAPPDRRAAVAVPAEPVLDVVPVKLPTNGEAMVPRIVPAPETPVGETADGRPITTSSTLDDLKPRAKKAAVGKARFRLVKKIPAAQFNYLRELMTPECRTHNAMVVKLLSRAGREGLSVGELLAAATKLGWETTSPNPAHILGWHVNHLRGRGILEVAVPKGESHESA